MEFTDRLKEIQQSLGVQGIEGWLLYDFRGNNPLAYTLLGIASDKMLSRRFFYWIPRHGDPIKIVPLIEPHTLDHLPGIKWFYRTWQELERLLFSIASENTQIAMEYSPYNSLPVVSKVDAGTVDLIRKSGAQVVSSANLLQKYTSVWSQDQLKSHLAAAEVLNHIVDITWEFIKQSLKNKSGVNEYQVQQFMLKEMEKQGCIADHAPICAVNANSADPHYTPQELTCAAIKSGDFILLDLWCKQNIPKAVYADIARVGVADSKCTEKQQEVFQIVKSAREKAATFIKSNYEKNQLVQGWEVDQICREVIVQAGFGEFFIHRTGHNIGEQVHGSGANLDNFETHDFRLLLPGTCFSVEPGIYLPQQFGVRLEYDIYLDPLGKVMITGGIQEEIVLLSE